MTQSAARHPFWQTTLMLAGLAWMALGDAASAQASKAAQKANSENVTFPTRDGGQLRGTYFPSMAGPNAPVAILLHGRGGNRLVWQAAKGQNPGFAQALQQNDFAVITVDLRHHGESGGAANPGAKKNEVKLSPRDYQAMVELDLEAVKKFLFDEHQQKKLNMNKLAIVSADFTTAVALTYTELDWSKLPYDDAPTLAQRTPRGQDVKALVMLSPETTVPGLVTTAAINRLRAMKMPVMIGIGKKDKADRGSAKKLAEQLMPKDEPMPYVFYQEYETSARGTDLLNLGVGVEPQMYKFLDEYLKKQPGEWRDRKSPLFD
uniref:AB hydrolase-1 domain-containing protein n=1 Tax=Schlesneria paludicola TaxID=360056 RepID=A0A7C2K1V2_9PLAN